MGIRRAFQVQSCSYTKAQKVGKKLVEFEGQTVEFSGRKIKVERTGSYELKISVDGVPACCFYDWDNSWTVENEKLVDFLFLNL